MESHAKTNIERQLEAAQQITHIGSWEWDLATNAVTWSDELYRIYGLAPRSCDITLESFLTRVHPDDRGMVQQRVGAALEGGSTFAWIERILRPDGSIRVLDTRGEVVRDEEGRTTALLGTCRDVTDERARDEQLRRYADIVHNVQIGLSVWKVEDASDASTFRLMAFNPAAERLARGPLGDFTGKTLAEIVPYAQGGTMQRLLGEVARDGTVREAEVLRSRDPRDPTRAVSMKAFPLPGGFVGIALEDITATTVTRRLQDAEQRVLERIAEGTPLEETLDAIVRAAEEHSPYVIGAINLRDDGGGTKRVAPSLDVDTDALHVYAVAPILSRDERDLGDFVLYTREARRQADEDAKLVDRLANLARIAIERRQLEDQLRELSAHVESIREDERTGIAREIHDELGQALTAIKLDIAWIVRRTAPESLGITREALLDKLQAMSKMTDEIIQQVRRISAELRPGILDDLGLVPAIEWQAQEFEQRTGTTCLVHAEAIDGIERHVATAVFRIFQEALTNVTRHAHAKHVDVVLRAANGALELEIRDDGAGISTEQARSPRSLGLLGMRERARRLGGTARVERGAEGGTCVALHVPLRGSEGR